MMRDLYSGLLSIYVNHDSAFDFASENILS